MKKFPFIISAFLFLWIAAADAHGPVRQKLEETISIDTTPDAVWEKIKNFDDMSWHPLVGKTEGNGGNQKGATRTLTLKEGGVITEELKKYEEKEREYSYRITDMSTVKTITHVGKEEPVQVLPVSNYSATISVKKGTSGGSEVVWKAAYYRGYMNNNPPAELNEEAANSAVQKVLKAGLENLKKTVEAK